MRRDSLYYTTAYLLKLGEYFRPPLVEMTHPDYTRIDHITGISTRKEVIKKEIYFETVP